MLYTLPSPDLEDTLVLDAIDSTRRSLANVLRTPRRWTGLLRRTAAAQAIQGSNTIEGYTVNDDDAIAAVDDEPPLTADEATWAEILGYRRVLTYVLNVATEPGFVADEAVIRAMHFMLLEHDLSMSPGRYRTSEIYVRDDRHDENVYEGPDPDTVPELMRELAQALVPDSRDHPLIRAAMAHLNLVMIHPFRDGNGRMARALQTLALAQDPLIEPAFSSIEEWLGANTQDYYDVLAATGNGRWSPDNDARLWLKFNLRAHHIQAHTVQRRFREGEWMWGRLLEALTERTLPERVGSALFDASMGLRVTRPSYVKLTGVDERTATRDLARAVDAGLLKPVGERRGRYYLAAEPLRELRREAIRSRRRLEDPYPTLMSEVRAARGNR